VDMGKLNVKLILVLGLVVALAFAGNFFIMKEQEKIKRLKAEEAMQVAQGQKKLAEEKLNKVVIEKDALKQDLVQEKVWSGSLQEQIKEKEKQVQEALNKMEEKNKVVDEALAKFEEEKKRSRLLENDCKRMENKISSLAKENKSLRQRLKNKGPSFAPAVELEKIVVTSGPRSIKEGKVLSINKEYGFIVVNLGAAKVKIGDKVYINRKDKLIAKAVIEKVEDSICAATVLPGYEQVEIKEGDLARVQ